MPDVKQAHLQTAQCQLTNQSLQKSLLCPPGKKNKKSSLSLKNKTLQTHNPTDKRNLTMTINMKHDRHLTTEKKEGQLVTRYIKNWADTSVIKHCSSHLVLCSLTGNRSEMPNFSYT